ncbi:gamma carbonic anhydrase family protein [Paenibacillus sp. 19GGS1-52]|uniref:gamma carbonic anhydrase family protein n=1 Tax=Paenibacillus sp. 19GGS1-52 TaxID=2758563 RepID=UPI001EFC2016|nr:gamma carbonic anhydrase family protein [Paenibacillus sp. 19GGS1-52]ULO09328.1 gamma carbonic anhydrase family protein [Paenibacillus sp. 19GGS1-52]
MRIAYGNYIPQLDDSVYVAEGVKLVGDVRIGQNSSIWFNAVLRGDLAPVIIGERCNIQDGAVGHVAEGLPLWLADDITVGHAAIIHGCRIGRGTLIGMGAIVLNGAEIGEYALIGAGSIVTENKIIPPYTLSLGSPAKVIRELTEKDLLRMARTTESYVQKAKEYRTT